MPAETPRPRTLVAALAAPGGPLRFAVAGAANTMVGYGTILLAGLAGAAPVLANACGYAVGLAFAYLLGKAWTFGPPSRRGSGARFVAAFLTAYGLNLVVLKVAIAVGLPVPVAQGAAMASYSVCFYLTCRAWVFGARRAGAA
jgi:putative flippase GtrA